MMKRLVILALAHVLAAGGWLAAAPPEGGYRMTVDLGAGTHITIVLRLEQPNGQWAGKFIGSTAELPPNTSVQKVVVAADRLRFVLKLGSQEMSFDGRLPADAQGKIPGSFALEGNLLLTALEPSKLTTFDRAALLKELVASTPPGPVFFGSLEELLRQATALQAKPEEVRAWADQGTKAAEIYGPRWQLAVMLKNIRALLGQPNYLSVNVALAQRAERLLEPADEIGVQMPVLEALARLLNESGKTADAKELQARIAKLEERDFQDYLKTFPVAIEKFAGRKGKSDRAVLVELFTGTECPPCVAADLAFDGLGRAYAPAEVVRLQYHLHIPGPDPLSNPASEARARYYGQKVEGTPTTLFNGKPEGEGGGGLGAVAAKFKQFRGVVDPILESKPAAQVKLTATRADNKISINARVSDIAKPDEKLKLRIALAEEVVRYQGGNGVRYHHAVVRGFAGSPEGFALKDASVDKTLTVDVEELRKGLNSYLDEFLKQNEGLTFPERPVGLKKLWVVAFVQDDATQEVLQTVQVEVP